MKHRRIILLALLVLQLLAACVAPSAVPTATTTAPQTAPQATLQATLVPRQARTRLTIFYTNDEHGWMAGTAPGKGAANLLGLWKQKEGYPKDGNFLVLSGGDNWTGPAISSWFQGQGMVEVMNSMGYAASAVGNHEFDFGLEALKARLSEAKYPYLSANIRRQTDGAFLTDLGIRPFTIVEVNGLKVGIIGLTGKDAATTTNPANLKGLEIIDYDKALREVLPEIRAAGANLILVPAHICLTELHTLALKAADLKIDLMGAGHCNEKYAKMVGDTIVLGGGSSLSSYAFATFEYDFQTQKIVSSSYGTQENEGGAADPSVAAIVSRWQAQTDTELNQPIGYLANAIPRQSTAMQDLTTGPWLWANPLADIALTNLGGMRDDLPAGKITKANIVNIMPFNNVLVQVRLSGSQVLQVITAGKTSLVIGGIHKCGSDWVLNKDGLKLNSAGTYTVLVNDFMYAGGDNYGLLAKFDPLGYNTSTDWRQPVIDWILAQNSTPDRPLDQAITGLGH